MNPYTDIDRLVFKLIHLGKIDYKWFKFYEEVFINNLIYTFNLSEGLITVNITNSNRDVRAILPTDSFSFINCSGEFVSCGDRQLIDDNESFEIKIENVKLSNPIFLGIKISDLEFMICEIPFHV